jgi:hypothetical protein
MCLIWDAGGLAKPVPAVSESTEGMCSRAACSSKKRILHALCAISRSDLNDILLFWVLKWLPSSLKLAKISGSLGDRRENCDWEGG